MEKELLEQMKMQAVKNKELGNVYNEGYCAGYKVAIDTIISLINNEKEAPDNGRKN